MYLSALGSRFRIQTPGLRALSSDAKPNTSDHRAMQLS